MLRNRIYYGLKPFVPQSVRTAIRRKLAMRLRKQIGDVWPIMPGSERPPENWPGWPEEQKICVCFDARRREQSRARQVPVLDATGTRSWIPLFL